MLRSSRSSRLTARHSWRRATLAVLLPMLLAAGATMAGSMYKSVGPDGRIVYSDAPPASGRVQKTLQFESAPSSPLPAIYVDALRRLRAEAAPPTTTGDVVLYSAVWCGYCKKAKAYLAGKGIAYREVDIDTNDGMAAFAQVGGGKGIPLLLAGGQRIQGFSTSAYDGLFSRRKGQ